MLQQVKTASVNVSRRLASKSVSDLRSCCCSAVGRESVRMPLLRLLPPLTNSSTFEVDLVNDDVGERFGE